VFQPWLPYHTSYLRPPTLTLLAALAPKGCTWPLWFSQIISSVPLGWPVVVGDWLNQMS
jgi:hypothetical protein